MMSKEPDYSAYVGCMEEIKKRQLAIDEIQSGIRTTSFKYTNIEFIALQFRKIFELIVLASLASNRHLFNDLSLKLSKEWEVKKIIAAVKRQNPNFYPKPIRRVPHPDPRIKDKMEDVTEGYLTLPELVEAHGQIGALMHAASRRLVSAVMALAEDDLVTARRHADRVRERGLRERHRLQEFLHQDFARMGVMEEARGRP